MENGGLQRENQVVVSDDTLMCKFQQGDEASYRRLLERYQDRIVNYVFRIVGDGDTAEDLAQEVFIRVYMNAGRYLPGSQFAPWLYRIASNLAINEIRRRKRWRFLSIDETPDDDDRSVPFEIADEEALNPENQLYQREASHLIEAALSKVPVKYRTPLILRELEGYDYEEIAVILNIPRGTVKSRLNRGRSLLKSAILRLQTARKVSA